MSPQQRIPTDQEGRPNKQRLQKTAVTAIFHQRIFRPNTQKIRFFAHRIPNTSLSLHAPPPDLSALYNPLRKQGLSPAALSPAPQATSHLPPPVAALFRFSVHCLCCAINNIAPAFAANQQASLCSVSSALAPTKRKFCHTHTPLSFDAAPTVAHSLCHTLSPFTAKPPHHITFLSSMIPRLGRQRLTTFACTLLYLCRLTI